MAKRKHQRRAGMWLAKIDSMRGAVLSVVTTSRNAPERIAGAANNKSSSMWQHGGAAGAWRKRRSRYRHQNIKQLAAAIIGEMWRGIMAA